MRLQNIYYTSSRKYSELVIATIAALVALVMVAALDSRVAAQNSTSNNATPRGARALAAVSAASFGSNEIAPDSIVAAFGTDLANVVRTNDSWPLPLRLAGTSVRLRDASGIEFDAPLFFVSPQQVNFYLPSQMAMGEATVTITSVVSDETTLSVGKVRVVDIAPGLFAMNGNGSGVAAATALRVRGSARYYEIVARYDLDQSKWVTLPIEPGPSADRVFLGLYGTGIRGRASLSDVTATLGGEPVAVSYAGAQGSYLGVDQVNIEIPREMFGRGEMALVVRVGDKVSNAVTVSLN